MDSSLLTIFANLGLPGIMLAVIVWMQTLCSHERREAREHYDKVIREVTAAFRENTIAVQEMKQVLAGFKEVMQRCDRHSH